MGAELDPAGHGCGARPGRPGGSELDLAGHGSSTPPEVRAGEELRGLESAAADVELVAAAADSATVTADSAAAANVGARGDVGEELAARAEGRRASHAGNGLG